jgi:hypothetical protein
MNEPIGYQILTLASQGAPVPLEGDHLRLLQALITAQYVNVEYQARGGLGCMAVTLTQTGKNFLDWLNAPEE